MGFFQNNFLCLTVVVVGGGVPIIELSYRQVILVQGERCRQKEKEKQMWFSFSQNKLLFLTVEALVFRL